MADWRAIERPAAPARPLLPPPVRRAVGTAATVVAVYLAAAVAAATVGVGFVADRGMLVVLPGFLAVFPLFAVTLLDGIGALRGRSALRMGSPLPLRRGRRRVLGAVFAVAVVCFFTANVDGQPEREGDRYVLNNHGDLTEVGRAEWLRARAAEVRLFGSGALVFATMSALWLTQDPEGDDPAPALPGADLDLRPPGPLQRLAGAAAVEAAGPGSPDEAVARIGATVPLAAVRGAGTAAVDLHADWDLPAKGFRPVFPVRLDATVRAEGPGRVAARVVVRSAAHRAVAAEVANLVVGTLFAAVGVVFIVAGGVPGAVIGLVWLAMLAGVHWGNHAPRWKAVREVADAVRRAVEAG